MFEWTERSTVSFRLPTPTMRSYPFQANVLPAFLHHIPQVCYLLAFQLNVECFLVIVKWHCAQYNTFHLRQRLRLLLSLPIDAHVRLSPKLSCAHSPPPIAHKSSPYIKAGLSLLVPCLSCKIENRVRPLARSLRFLLALRHIFIVFFRWFGVY